MKHHQITASMAKDIAFKLGAELNDDEAEIFVDGYNVAMLQSSQPVSNHDELPYAQVKAVADLFALCWQSGEVVTYTPDPEKATIWLNNYSGTCVQEYVKLERLQEALSGNSPVIPEGYALVPIEATAEMLQASYRESSVYSPSAYRAMIAAAPQQEEK
ncbi:eaa protein [Salmonella enterica]|nr:eaa protein [Salmonella enterica]